MGEINDADIDCIIDPDGSADKISNRLKVILMEIQKELGLTSIQILATRFEPDNEDVTRAFYHGYGDIYARRGVVRRWIKDQETSDREELKNGDA